ncbi:nuclear transport factor 2 family protein [Mycolicibacterium komossense]|uniref:Nuclear transport factor 2 family protein n=1 Tax=Mycolicibacterium komossense TaxID=1779 RepID=A0ABT3C8G5_9MYCO|nr:nuclear transport factor 2 family protein [Mycolicibacterium komossense]MCV7225777.1 nuclear transport factor 2 family protein [Mycolicibacterium komossense]
MTTPFDDPQAELAWMFLQSLCEDGDLDEGLALLSDDFSYWNNTTRRSSGKDDLRQLCEWRKAIVELSYDLLGCLNDGQSVMVEAQAEGVTSTGIRYDCPMVFIFETDDGLITSLREYGDTQLNIAAFGAETATPR